MRKQHPSRSRALSCWSGAACVPQRRQHGGDDQANNQREFAPVSKLILLTISAKVPPASAVRLAICASDAPFRIITVK